MNELIKNLGVIVPLLVRQFWLCTVFYRGMTNSILLTGSGIGSPWLFWSYRNQQTSRIIHAT